MSTPPDNTDRSARYNLHKPGGNYTGPVRPLTEGLAAQGLGVIDVRALCFIAVAAGPVGEPGGANFDDTLPPEVIVPESLINITDVQALGSFSWSNDRDVDVLIPGSPPIWLNSPVPFSILPDSEIPVEVSPEADKSGELDHITSLLAFTGAVKTCTPSFSFGTADIIADRNSLRNLLRWVERSPRLSDFRVDLFLVGKRTLVIRRFAQQAQIVSTPGSYGFSYERHNTQVAPGCETSRQGGHNRIVSYHLGGLRMVVQFQVNAILPALQEPPADVRHDHESSTSQIGSLKFKRAGSLPAQSRLVELVTRSKTTVKNFHRREVYPHLALSQAPHLIIAVHKQGTFTDIKHEELDIHPNLVSAAEMSQDSLRRLQVLLTALRDTALALGEPNGVALVCIDRKLEVFDRSDGHGLATEFLDQFAYV